MDLNGVVQVISQVGFPIACCVAMGWYVKYTGDKHATERQELQETHSEEMNKVTEAVKNNTIALTSLTEVIRGGK